MPWLNNDTDVLECVEIKSNTGNPDMIDVFFYNDDVTPMDAVVIILMEAFGHQLQSALEIMLNIHTSDKGLVGTYPAKEAYDRYEVAEKLKEEFDVPLVIELKNH